jgi:hypothetical protein
MPWLGLREDLSSISSEAVSRWIGEESSLSVLSLAWDTLFCFIDEQGVMRMTMGAKAAVMPSLDSVRLDKDGGLTCPEPSPSTHWCRARYLYLESTLYLLYYAHIRPPGRLFSHARGNAPLGYTCLV